ncbi:MAG: NAD(P)-dependent oxidoreductase [Casimicrobiaceae bacterium]|nr:NAD(P)-dependent oxidoreductase [Casimicrobiaceae bacterium]MDW8312683.1 NAD(P)-dependent oxidoreductase [Burkholderiales bacterium]
MSSRYSAMRWRRLLLTGAAGQLGRVLRPRLAGYCDFLRVSDISELGGAGPGEELIPARLEDAAAVFRLLEGVDAVVHLGGVSTEEPWSVIAAANIHGIVHLYEAARVHGVRRIVYASSNHVVGCYRQDEVLDATVRKRPDGFYGLSKAFGEDCAQLYWDRFGIETVSLRIGSCFPEPSDRRMLRTWLSHDDFERLVIAALAAPNVGHTIVYGVSDNPARFWDNRYAQHLAWQPRDTSEPFRASIEAREGWANSADPAQVLQGGSFLAKTPRL